MSDMTISKEDGGYTVEWFDGVYVFDGCSLTEDGVEALKRCHAVYDSLDEECKLKVRIALRLIVELWNIESVFDEVKLLDWITADAVKV